MEDNRFGKKINGMIYRLVALLTVLVVIICGRMSRGLEAVTILYLIFSL